MATKTLSASYGPGYGLDGTYQTISVTASGYVGGRGIYGKPGTLSAYTVVNDGTIDGTLYGGVNLYDGGSVTNAASASITARTLGVYIVGAAATVANDGIITGGIRYYGVMLTDGGLVTNGVSGSITGGYGGVFFKYDAGTVVNNGTIIGTKFIGLD